MENNMTPYSLAVGTKNIYFISTHYKFIENDMIQPGTLLNSLMDSLDPFDYHKNKCGPDCFKTLLECNRIHSCWPWVEEGLMEEDVMSIEDDDVEEDGGDGEDDDLAELHFCKGSNGLVKILNEKCVICLGWHRDQVFKQCGHQCFCEQCYQNKGNIDI